MANGVIFATIEEGAYALVSTATSRMALGVFFLSGHMAVKRTAVSGLLF